MRLDKFLSSMFIATRKEAKKIIKNKQVKVNNEIITDESKNIDELNDLVCVNEKIIKYQKYFYYALNKPKGFVTSTKDPTSKTIMELFSSLPKQKLDSMFPVGRLDKDTEGLIFVTNDGDFSHKITSPTSNISKTYYVEYEGTLIENYQELLKSGLILDDGTKCLSAEIDNVTNKSFYLTIKEGKYHQVKKMTHKLGVVLTYLKRVKIASYSMPKNLEPKMFIELDINEIKKIIE